MPFLLKISLAAALVFFVAACRHLPIESPTIKPAPERLNFLALGDSYTIGQSVAEAERWPNQLADSLQKNGTPIERPTIIARTGWRTDQLENEVVLRRAGGQLDSVYALVTLLIGVNDQYQNRTAASYRPRFENMLDIALGLAGGRPERVAIVSIPDYAFTPFGAGSAAISTEIDSFNLINQEISAARGVQYFDITPISRLGLQQPELVAADKLHPSGEQYRRWVASFWRSISLR